MMSNTKLLFIAALALVAVIGPACKKKSEVQTALDNAVQAVGQADPNQQTTPANQPPTPAANTPVAPANQSGDKTEMAQQMSQAVAAYKGGNFEDAVKRLQWLRAQKTSTPQQLAALQEAMAAVMGDIYARAAKGDAKAKAAVKDYEAMQNAASR